MIISASSSREDHGSSNNNRGGISNLNSRDDDDDIINKNFADDDGATQEDIADIAREMYKLTVQERETVLEDLHGVAKPLEETCNLITKCLAEFDHILSSQISQRRKKVVERAFFLRPGLGTDRKFKLMFLRAEGYDANKAVQRMIHFFELKGTLFDSSKLGKDIMFDDLTEIEKQAVSSGFIMQLPTCNDRSGRPIIVLDVTKLEKVKEGLSAMFYVIMSALEDEIAQTKGIIVVNFFPKKRMGQIPFTSFMENELISRVRNFSLSMPCRITGYHFLTNAPAVKFIISLLRFGHTTDIKLRRRIHFGSEVELQYSLLSYGIRLSMAFLASGNGKTEFHDKYLERRFEIESAKKQKHGEKTEEESNKVGEIIDYPTPKDALIGRGFPFHDFVGTRALIEIIDKHLDRYFDKTNDRFKKTVILMEVVSNFQLSGGRFLHRTSTGWQILDDDTSRQKAGNLLRYRQGLLQKQQRKSPPGAITAATIDQIVSSPSDTVHQNKRQRT